MTRARHWVFTSYSDCIPFWDDERIAYIIFGNEKCPKTGRWHKQGYVKFNKLVRLTQLKNLDSTVHWEVKRGTVREAIDYCKKDGDYYERGDVPVEERSNANVYSECIALAEKGNMEELKQLHPGQFLRYKRTFEGLVKYSMRTYDTPRGYWVFGKPGCGKDSSIMELKPFIKSHNKWWDGYDGEKYILYSDLDELDAKWIGNYLKTWTDRYPFTAECKGTCMKISPERFYVTTNYRLEDLFTGDMYTALKRRFHVIDFDNKVVHFRPVIQPECKIKLIDF